MRFAVLLLTVVGLVLILLLGIPALRDLLSSEETKIRLRIAEAIGDFNEGRVRAVEVLASGFRAEPSGMDRDRIRAAIAYNTLQQRTADGRFGYRLEVVSGEDAVVVTVDASDGTATATIPLRLYDERRVPADLVWEFDVEGDLRAGEAGWQFLRARHETISGRQPR